MSEDDKRARPTPPRWLRPIRRRAVVLPGGLIMWRVVIALVGAAVVGLGVLLVPLPGPGWAIVFLGVGVWATEFHWAQRLLRYGRRRMQEWTAWTMRQSLGVQLLIGTVGIAFIGSISWFLWTNVD